MYDYLIVGGGSAGCVMANRLSADPSVKVLLIEAGRDTPPDQVEEEILDTYPKTAFTAPRNLWSKLQVHMTEIPHNAPHTAAPTRRYEQARIMGGGSSINGQQANRGTPEDYQEWVDRGAIGWGWDDVMPFFKKLERDMDFDGPMHGKAGPIAIRRISPAVWPNFTKAVAASLTAEGIPYLDDQNGSSDDGHFPLAISNLYDRRISTAIAYLDQATRRRTNLTIMSGTEVLNLTNDGDRVTGVRIRRPDNSTEVIAANEVIVSAGAIHSPALLLRSGIGPADHLKTLGIEVFRNVRGVGQGVQEHPTVSVSCVIDKKSRLGKLTRRQGHIGARYSSGVKDCAPTDMYFLPVAKSGWHAVGEMIGTCMLVVNKPYSRGKISLYSSDPGAEPKVEFNLLSDWRDRERLMNAVKMGARLFSHPELKAAGLNPFPTSYTERVRNLNAVSFKNWASTQILSRMLDSSSLVRSLLIKHVVTEGFDLQEIVNDDEKLEKFCRAKVSGLWHVSASCQMGKADDPMAVVDPEGNVYGIRGLRVVDASIMPSVPRANTNVPTIMIAEKISQAIIDRRSQRSRANMSAAAG